MSYRIDRVDPGHPSYLGELSRPEDVALLLARGEDYELTLAIQAIPVGSYRDYAPDAWGRTYRVTCLP